MDSTKQKAASPGRGKAAANTISNANQKRGIDSLLSRLQGVQGTGQDRWMARCPGPMHEHGDRHPSLSVRETDSGTVLVHCWAGCSAHEIVTAVGLELADLFPPRPANPAQVGKPERRPFSSDDALRCLDFEACVVYLCASDLAKGKSLSYDQRSRLLLAAGRIATAMEATCLTR